MSKEIFNTNYYNGLSPRNQTTNSVPDESKLMSNSQSVRLQVRSSGVVRMMDRLDNSMLGD